MNDCASAALKNVKNESKDKQQRFVLFISRVP